MMGEASKGPWIEYEHNPRAMQLRECTLKEFWEMFVNDRPSHAMTLMDKIRGWEDESCVGSKFAACKKS